MSQLAVTLPAAGIFIVFEGGDGVGKSTQIELLAQAFEEFGYPVVTTRQPGGTALGEQVRSLVLHGEDLGARAEALLFAADKAHHVEQVVRPALAAGQVVLSDRYVDSAIAYQGAGRALGVAQVAEVNWWAVGGLRPDLTIVLDTSVDQAAARRTGRGDRVEQEERDFHEQVRRHFIELAQTDPERYLVIDAAEPIERVHHQVVQACLQRGWLR